MLRTTFLLPTMIIERSRVSFGLVLRSCSSCKQRRKAISLTFCSLKQNYVIFMYIISSILLNIQNIRFKKNVIKILRVCVTLQCKYTIIDTYEF